MNRGAKTFGDLKSIWLTEAGHTRLEYHGRQRIIKSVTLKEGCHMFSRPVISVCVFVVLSFCSRVLTVRAEGIDEAMIAKAVAFQDESCHQLDGQIENLQKILDRTKSGTTPKDIARVVLDYKNQAKASKVDWRKFVRNQIADIERQRDEIANNRTAVLPLLRLRGQVGDFGVARTSLMITNEAMPTKFFGLAKVGANEDAYETFVVEGWKFNSIRSQKVELPRDVAKLGRRESGGARVIDIKDLHSAIQGSLLSSPAGPEVRQIGLNGIARIASTTMVKNAWGTAIDGTCECKVIEFVCTEDELRQAVIASRDAAKKKDGKE